MDKIKIILSGGGTGGHIYPAVAVAEALQRRLGDGVELLFVGAEGKMEMEKIPLLSHWMRNLHCLFLDRKNLKKGMKTIMTAIEKVKAGISICIFPEGTRNKVADTFLPFHGGSFKIAEKTNCPIVPMAINNAGSIFEDHLPTIKKTHVVLEYGEPIYPDQLSKEDRKRLSEITLERIQEMYFKNKELV